MRVNNWGGRKAKPRRALLTFVGQAPVDRRTRPTEEKVASMAQRHLSSIQCQVDVDPIEKRIRKSLRPLLTISVSVQGVKCFLLAIGTEGTCLTTFLGPSIRYERHRRALTDSMEIFVYKLRVGNTANSICRSAFNPDPRASGSAIAVHGSDASLCRVSRLDR